MSARDPREGHAGEPGQRAAGATGGVGGVGGEGGEPGGQGGAGGQGGDVYIDSRRVARWVRWVAVGFVMLALSTALGFWLIANEHDNRVKDNARQIILVKRIGAEHDREDERLAAQAIAADCRRTREIRKILLEEKVITSQAGKDALTTWLVKYGSRKGC